MDYLSTYHALAQVKVLILFSKAIDVRKSDTIQILDYCFVYSILQ